MPTTKKRPAKKPGQKKRPAKATKTRGRRKTKTRRPVLRDEHYSRGRPTRATAFLMFKILLARREGLSLRYCGGPAGITPETLRLWLTDAERHASSWHGRLLPKPVERAYLEMDLALATLASRYDAAKRSSEEAQRHIRPDYSGIEDFRADAVGHWLSFLDQWEAVTAIYVRDLASTIRRHSDWRAQAWLLERFAGDDYNTHRGAAAVGAIKLGDDAEVSVSLRIAPPVGRGE